MPSDLYYKIALTRIPHVGSVLAKELVSYCGSPEGVFFESSAALQKIPGIGRAVATCITSQAYLKGIDNEIENLREYGIKPLFYLDDAYPSRLKHVRDAPVLLYYRGRADLNSTQVLSVVGTRRPTAYGQAQLDRIMGDLAGCDLLVVSGLAYGIDIQAHRLALQNQLPTVAVLGSGLGCIYPSAHKKVASEMVEKGGLLSEFSTFTQAEREHFPMRNRIIAALCDALLVIESDVKGGSMISAHLANDYHKDVFALPGSVDSILSRGTNLLIKKHLAHLVDSACDMIEQMNWCAESQTPTQLPLFQDLSADELALLHLFPERSEVHLEYLYRHSSLTPGTIAGLLLNLEFAGVIKALPGKQYRRLR